MKKMVAETRDFGDNQTIVVYTQDNSIYRQMKRWKSCQQVVPYFQNGRVIGVDLYFPKQVKDEVRKALGLPAKANRKRNRCRTKEER